jgi:hypothetical protein
VTITPPPNSRGWHNQPVTVEVRAVEDDDSSGVRKIRYTVDRYAVPPHPRREQGEIDGDRLLLQVSDEDLTEIRAEGEDAAGNKGSLTLTSVRIDRIPPVTTATVTPAPDADGVRRPEAQVQLSAIDRGSSPREIRYQMSGAQMGSGTITGGSGTLVIRAEGTTAITYFAVDEANNLESPQSLTVHVGPTSP